MPDGQVVLLCISAGLHRIVSFVNTIVANRSGLLPAKWSDLVIVPSPASGLWKLWLDL